MKTNRRAKSLRKSALYAAISLCTLQAGLLAPAFAEDENKLTFSGDIRAGWLEYDYGNPQGVPTINKGHKDWVSGTKSPFLPGLPAWTLQFHPLGSIQ